MNLGALHRTSVILVAAFALVHVVNHLVSLAGVSSHIAFMEVARRIYRQPIVETLLLACVAFQVVSGAWFVASGWKRRRGVIAWLQAGSGMVLVFFLFVHVGAVLYGRGVLHLDTNFYFAAAGFHVPPNQLFFGPYYFAAVLAFFTHIGCAAYWRFHPVSPRSRAIAVALPMLVGGLVALLIVSSLAGMLQPVEVPAAYKAIYARQGS